MRRLLSITLISLLFTVAVGAILWQQGKIQAWAKAQIVKAYLHYVAPQLPFEIEELTYEASWKEIRSGHLPKLTLLIRYQDWKFFLEGPLQLSQTQTEIGLHFAPNASVLLPYPTSSVTVDLTLQAKWIKKWRSLEPIQVNLQVGSQKFSWPAFGIKTAPLQVQLKWHSGEKFRINIGIDSLDYTASPQRLVHTGKMEFEASTPFIWGSPIQAPGPLEFKLTLPSAEILWDEIYLDLPLNATPLLGSYLWLPSQEVQLRSPKGIDLSASYDQTTHLFEANWKTSPLFIPDLLKHTLASTSSSGGSLRSLAPLREMVFVNGRFQTRGFAQFQNGSLKTLTSRNEISHLSLKWPSNHLALKDLKLSLPISLRQPTQGKISFDLFSFRRWKTSLPPTPVKIIPPFRNSAWNATLGKQEFPLQVYKLPLKIGQIQIELNHGSPKLTSSLDLAAYPVRKVLKRICLENTPVPPSSVGFHFEKVEVTPSTIDITGDLHAYLFDGVIDVDEIGIYDLDTPVPELDFNMDFQGIRLDQIGRWFSFGEMDGALTGFAHDVTFQSWLPTQYAVKLDAKPYRFKDVIFSTDAMKNIVLLVGGEEAANLPGIADWLAFGLPMKLMGGYNVQYAGFDLVSSGGYILLETHDPPEQVKEDPKHHHYLLSGKNFKMPLRSSHYPLVVDATAMSNYVHQMIVQFGKIDQSKAEKARANLLEKEDEDELPSDCYAPGF